MISRMPWIGTLFLTPIEMLMELTERIIGFAIEVHRRTGPGLLELVYAACLSFELEQAGIPLPRQVGIPAFNIRSSQ